jgi:hypothetical protein
MNDHLIDLTPLLCIVRHNIAATQKKRNPIKDRYHGDVCPMAGTLGCASHTLNYAVTQMHDAVIRESGLYRLIHFVLRKLCRS